MTWMCKPVLWAAPLVVATPAADIAVAVLFHSTQSVALPMVACCLLLPGWMF